VFFVSFDVQKKTIRGNGTQALACPNPSAFSAFSARVIALRIANPYSILRQIANLPQQVATE
jgi:hypothetical protein